ncbi:MAG: stage III sporulation protein AF [Clostridiales bacterium]|nr:stage III sporulation protein AF [Clostridiales bacterium]
MISFLKSWIMNIVVLIIFLALAEIILPSNSMRKYARFVMGLIIIVVIITPIFKLFDKQNSIEGAISEYERKYEEVYKGNINSKELEKTIQRKTINEFEKKLKENIENDVLKNTGKKIAVNKLDVNTKLGSEDFGAIMYIEIKVTSNSDIQPVEKVVIGGQTNSKSNYKDNEILEFVSKNYKVNEKNIVFVK